MRSILLAALLAAPAFSQSPPMYPPGQKAIVYEKWGGLNLLQDSAILGDDAQVAQNVLTDNSYLEKRPGNVLLTTILSSSTSKYVTGWSSPGGNLYIVAQASQTIYETNFSGPPVALSTIPVGFNVTTVAAFSKLEFADGTRQIWYWDGVSTSTVKDAASLAPGPVCTYNAFKDNRLWCANLPNGFTESGNTQNGGGSSTVLISSSGGDGYWAVPSNVSLIDNAPNRFDFNPNDGDQITCMASTPWGMFIGKRNSSYIIKGNGNLSYNPRILDPQIGCVDNRSVQMVYGVFQWLAVDGVYGYDGSGPPRLLSRELDPLVKQIREATFSQGQWATQLQTDWATGTESTVPASLPALPWDYTTIPGTVFPSSGTLYDDNTNPALQNCTSSIDPANGLPWSCGVGFSSDTLVNIDTTSFPLSVGMAQIAPSTSGVQVWLSTFPLGNYTTLVTTWTVVQGGLQSAGNAGVITNNSNQQTYQTIFYTMAASSGPPPSANGWNFGTWSFDWYPVLDSVGGANYGTCTPGGAAATCLEYHFIANMSQVGGAAWSGYGVAIASPNGANPYNITLFKEVSGVRTPLGGSYSFTIPTSLVAPTAVISTFTITRLPGGCMSVSVNSANAINACDKTSIANTATITEALLQGTALPAALQVGENVLYSTKLNGYGTGSIVSHIFNMGAKVPLAGVFSSTYSLNGVVTGSLPETEIDFYVRDSTSPNNDLWSSWTASSNSVLAALPEQYWQYEALFTSRVASQTAVLNSVELGAVTTGYYYSQVDFIGNLITSWRQLGITENTPGVYGYAVRVATYSFPVGDTSIAWSTQTANVNLTVGVSTPSYAQFRLDSTSLVTNNQGASAAEPISAVFLRWNQGANIPVASATLDRRYYLCVAISTSASAPDTCLIRQKNGKWVTWTNGGTIGSMGIYNYQIVAADGGTSSNIWEIMQPNVYSDNGVAINSIWTSADETDNLPFNDKTYYGTLIDAQPVQGSSVTFSYAVNKTNTFNSQTFTTDNGQALDPAKPVLGSQLGNISMWQPAISGSGYNTGKYIRSQFSDSTLQNYFRINSYTTLLLDNPWYPP